MPLQKKKHPKYRKKKTEDERKRLRKAIQLKEQQSLKRKLYSLPLDVKKLIFRMTIQSHLNDWLDDHKVRFSQTISLIRGEKKDIKEDERGNRILRFKKLKGEGYDDEIHFIHYPLCRKYVRKRGQPGIKDVYISPYSSEMNTPISLRQWTNEDIHDKYWYHTNCRCKLCDMVRICGYYSLNLKERRKFSRITLNRKKGIGTWNTKSLRQVKYEKDLHRRSKRNDSRKIIPSVD